MDTEERIKLYGMSHSLVERDLDKVEDEFKIDFQRTTHSEKDEEYYPQFDHALRVEAAEMGEHYELFYCLENGIRKLLADTLQAIHGDNWWDKCVPKHVKDNAAANIKREEELGVTPRSDHDIDYTTFGELAEIVRKNSDDFGSIFSSQKAFNRIMTNLNNLRGSIAHCNPLAPDEVVRLKLTISDWFRLME